MTNVISFFPVDAAHVLELVRVITEIFIAVVVVTGDGGDGHGAVLGEQHPLLLAQKRKMIRLQGALHF